MSLMWAMTWDGSYQYLCTLLYQNPFTYGTLLDGLRITGPDRWSRRTLTLRDGLTQPLRDGLTQPLRVFVAHPDRRTHHAA